MERRQRRLAFVATAAGILAFMAALALALGVLQALGRDVFWGMQFQEPIFVSALLAIVALLTLDLAGVFEIRLPATWQNSIGQWGRASDAADGFLIALIATPCSAPFLGTAIGFGLAGGAGELALTFAALGLGVRISLPCRRGVAPCGDAPAAAGAWMMWVQRGLTVPMLLIVAWLASVLLAQVGSWAVVAVLAAVAMLAIAAKTGGDPRGDHSLCAPVMTRRPSSP